MTLEEFQAKYGKDKIKNFKNSWHARRDAINLLPIKQQVLYAIDCAFLILPIWQKSYPENKCPEEAIKLALKSVLEGNVKEKELVVVAATVSNTARQVPSPSAETNTVYAAINVALAAKTVINYTASKTANTIYWTANTITWKSVKDLYNQADQPFKEHYRTPDTLGLAKEIINNKDFSLMPVLADALIDLGCPEEQADLVRNNKSYSNWTLYNLVIGD